MVDCWNGKYLQMAEPSRLWGMGGLKRRGMKWNARSWKSCQELGDGDSRVVLASTRSSVGRFLGGEF